MATAVTAHGALRCCIRGVPILETAWRYRLLRRVACLGAASRARSSYARSCSADITYTRRCALCSGIRSQPASNLVPSRVATLTVMSMLLCLSSCSCSACYERRESFVRCIAVHSVEDLYQIHPFSSGPLLQL